MVTWPEVPGRSAGVGWGKHKCGEEQAKTCLREEA